MGARRALAVAAVVLSTVAFAAVLAGPASADPEGWTVSSSTTLEGVTLTIAGELRVAPGATLTLDHVLLTVAPGATTAPSLVVEPGARLVMLDSTVRAAGDSAAEAVFVSLKGSADIRSSTFHGLAADPTRAVGAPVAGGMRLPWGGVVIESSDVRIADTTVEEARGCAVSIVDASPAIYALDISGVSWRTADGASFAAGLCVQGGAATVDGLKVTGIGGAGAASGFAAGVVAVGVDGFTLRGFESISPFASPPGGKLELSAALVLQDPATATIDGGELRGSESGILMRTGAAAHADTDVTFAHIRVMDIVAPVNVFGSYSGPTNLLWENDTILGSGTHGLYFESSGSSGAVTATADNVTALNSTGVGIYMFANGGTNTHNFNAWTSNASGSGQQGFYFRGQSMGLGYNVQMSTNGAYQNALSGIQIDATYAGALAKISSAKLEFNVADNNSYDSPSQNGGGIILNFGTPHTATLRYLNNTARGNGDATGFATYYGHYINVQVVNSITILTGQFSGIVALKNIDYGIAIIAGAGVASRIDSAVLRDSEITGHPTGIYMANGGIEVWTSTLGNAVEFEGSLTDFVVLGSVHTRLTGTTTGVHTIRSCKLIDIHAVWQNSAPAVLMPISFTARNNSAATIYSSCATRTGNTASQTDATGYWTGWVLDWTFDPTIPQTQNQRVDYAPLVIALTQFGAPAKSDPFDLQLNILGTLMFIDPAPPTLIVSTPRENGTYTTSNLTVSGDVTDELSGVAALDVSLDGSNWTRAVSGSGSFAYTFVGLADGDINVWVRAWDRANEGLDPRNEVVVVLYQISIDTIAPAINVFSPPNLQDGGVYYTNQEQIVFQGNVDTTVVALFMNGLRINLTGTVFQIFAQLLNEGPQGFLFLAIDGAGNTRNLTFTIIRDTVPPTLVVTDPGGAGDVYVAAHSMTIQGITDANAYVTVNGINATLSGTTFQSVVTLVEGRNTVSLRAVDAAQNAATRTLIVWADTVAPVISVASHAAGAFINSSRIDLVGTVSEPLDIITVNLRIFVVVGLDWQATLGLQEGPNTLNIEARDRAGNRGALVLTVTVDTVPPEILLYGLPDYTVVNSAALLVSATVSEPAEVTLDGRPEPLADLAFEDSITLSEGDNVVEVVARDSAGNTATAVRHVRLDTQLPTIAITEPASGSTVAGRFVRIVGTAEPNATVRVGSQIIAVDASGHFVAYVQLEADGANNIVITVTDEAKNSVSKTFPVMYTPPVTDNSGETMMWVALAAVAAVGLIVGGRMFAKRRVDADVEEALKKQAAQAQPYAGYTEGYADEPPADPAAYTDSYAQYQPAEGGSYADPYAQGAAPEGATYSEPYAESPPPEPAGYTPPRPPRPPRPPTS